MNFTWEKDNPQLTKAAAQDGCGLTKEEVATITVQQKQDGYEFNYHIGYHGRAGSDYVYIVPNGTKGKDFPRGWLTGKNSGKIEDPNGLLTTKMKNDAIAVIGNGVNAELMVRVAANYRPARGGLATG